MTSHVYGKNDNHAAGKTMLESRYGYTDDEGRHWERPPTWISGNPAAWLQRAYKGSIEVKNNGTHVAYHSRSGRRVVFRGPNAKKDAENFIKNSANDILEPEAKWVEHTPGSAISNYVAYHPVTGRNEYFNDEKDAHDFVESERWRAQKAGKLNVDPHTGRHDVVVLDDDDPIADQKYKNYRPWHYNVWSKTSDSPSPPDNPNRVERWLSKSERRDFIRKNIEQMNAEKMPRTESTDEIVIGLLYEALSSNAKASEWISDFVHSDDPRFDGKSKAKRIKMALAAYYSNKNESVEINEISAAAKKRYASAARADAVGKRQKAAVTLDRAFDARSDKSDPYNRQSGDPLTAAALKFAADKLYKKAMQRSKIVDKVTSETK